MIGLCFSWLVGRNGWLRGSRDESLAGGQLGVMGGWKLWLIERGWGCREVYVNFEINDW